MNACEARWAVFLDHLGVPWELRPEKFSLEVTDIRRNKETLLYSPSFRVHPGSSLEFWLDIEEAPGFYAEDSCARAFLLASQLAGSTKTPVVVQWGDPQPPPDLRHMNGDVVKYFGFNQGAWVWHASHGWVWDSGEPGLPQWELDIRPSNVRFPRLSKDFKQFPEADASFWWWVECLDCKQCLMRVNGTMAECPLVDNPSEITQPLFQTHTPRLLAAYAAARAYHPRPRR